MILVLSAVALLAAIGPAPVQPAPQVPSGPAVTRLEASSAPTAGPSEAADKMALAELPDSRLTVAGAVGGQGPFRFLVDTAADRSAVSYQLAARLGLRPGGTAKLHSVSGLSNVQTTSVRGLRIASRTLPSVTAPLLDATHV